MTLVGSQKRITVLQLVLSLSLGGTEKVVYDLVRRMNDADIRTVVCCLDEIGEFGDMLRETEGVPVRRLGREPGLDFPLFSRIAKQIQSHDVDILHAHHYTPFFYGLFGAWMARRTPGSPPRVVFTEHGIEYPYRKKWKRCLVNPILLRMADSVTTIAHYTRRNLERYENYPKGGVRVLYNGIDVAAYSQGESPQAARSFLGIPAEKKTVGVVARLDPVKNHPLLFRSLREVIQFFPETELLIVGDGPNRAELELLANRLGLDSHIRFLGARRDVPHIIRAMDIFVLPSLSEGMSITLLEAMGAGLPVVATRVGGNPEVVVDGETGFLVPSDDERRMAARLKTLLGDSRLRQKMGAAGKLRAESVFSMEKTVSEYHRLYEKVLKNERV